MTKDESEFVARGCAVIIMVASVAAAFGTIVVVACMVVGRMLQ